MITYNRTNQRMMAMLALVLVLGSILAPAVHAQSRNYAFQLINVSSFRINEVYFSSVDSGDWGYDQLGRSSLVPGYNFTMYRYGRYDLKLVDEDGDVCVVSNLSVYQDSYLRITDAWLLGCEARTR